MDQEDIAKMEQEDCFVINTSQGDISLSLSDVEIVSEDIPGWLVTNEGNVTVALDINVTEDLKDEGMARELINRIQNIRKESGFDVTDKINIAIQANPKIDSSVEKHKNYIAVQTLAQQIELVYKVNSELARNIEIDDDINIVLKIERV
jgi:isoleucyl-tRNA synthetase